MAAHPGAYVRGSVRPDFNDAEHMPPTYQILNGIANRVFERLTAQVNTPRADVATLRSRHPRASS